MYVFDLHLTKDQDCVTTCCYAAMSLWLGL